MIKSKINFYVRDNIVPTTENFCYVDMNDFLAENGVEGNPIKDGWNIDSLHPNPAIFIEYKRFCLGFRIYKTKYKNYYSEHCGRKSFNRFS